MLSHVLGYVGIDNQGLSGLELEYDKYLTGVLLPQYGLFLSFNVFTADSKSLSILRWSCLKFSLIYSFLSSVKPWNAFVCAIYRLFLSGISTSLLCK